MELTRQSHELSALICLPRMEDKEGKNEDFSLPNEQLKTRHTKEHFDLVSKWYENLKGFTWETKFVQISALHASAISSYRSKARG